MCYNCLDRHCQDPSRAASKALIYISNMTNQQKIYSYEQLLKEVSKFGYVLQKFGIKKGDRVVIFCPMIPEALISILGCSRIGAIHSIVFGGFAAKELQRRITDCQPKLIISASCGLEPHRAVDYKGLVDKAIVGAQIQVKTIIIQREQLRTNSIVIGRDFDYHSLMEMAEESECVPVEGTHPLYILYTSGTSGEPKGIVRDTGGTAVALTWTMEHIMGVKQGDVYFSTSDIGWVVGHSFIIYGPLLLGATTVIYEGKPVGTPDPAAWWRIVEEHRVVGLYTAPTAIRALKKEDPEGQWIRKHDISSLKAVSFAGERCDIKTYQWLTENLKGVLCNDNYWQTETGWIISCNYTDLYTFPPKPGSATKPCPGFNLKIMNDQLEELPCNELGKILIKLPLPPSFMLTLWANDQAFLEKYIKYPGYYMTGDAGYFDQDGYLHVMTRLDDVINTAGHRLSTAQMEEVLLQHPLVNEAAVVSVKEDFRGEVPVGFVCLKNSQQQQQQQQQQELELDTQRKISAELIQLVRNDIGPVAVFRSVIILSKLPKTRSGKILRYSLKKILDGEPFEMPPTIEDKTVYPEIQLKIKQAGYGVKANIIYEEETISLSPKLKFQEQELISQELEKEKEFKI